MKDKVVLLYPPYDGPPLGPPLSLLSLAGLLRESGFRVSILDSAVEQNLEAALAAEIQDSLCIGISFLTGPMIRGAVALAELSRCLQSDVPIVFGGWHSSLLPEQTLASGKADVVVRGQGERTLLEIARCLQDGQTIESIPGLSYRKERRAMHNPERSPERLNDLPLPAFSMVNFDAYERVSGVRKLPYASSLGCPYACNYCTDQVFYERKFNAYPASRVVAEVTDLVSRYRLREVAFLDSNFPVHVRRAVEIAKGFIDANVPFEWTFQASTDLLCRMTDDEVCLLAESGVTHMGFGTESASEKVLALMNKRHQRIDEMFETARKANIAGIRVTFNLILGYPEETQEDRIETFRVMTEISAEYPNVRFSPNIFTPYPGIPIWPQLKAMGVREPESLEEWADVGLGSNHLPWLQDIDLRNLRHMLTDFLESTNRRKSGIVSRRSLLTGQALATAVDEVC